MRARFSVLVVLAMVLSVVPMASVAANGAGTVSGTVTLDGVGLEGVEVFLADGVGGRYTCTDDNGYYQFENAAGFIFVATGPAVSDEGCSNPEFVDDTGHPLVPMTDFDGTNWDAINFEVVRFPVSGTVTLDGDPLDDVEVFLADGVGGRYTCTDGNGDYEFGEPRGFVSVATGPAVSDEGCSNRKFLDDEGHPLVPVQINRSGDWSGEDVNFDVESLPEDHPGFFHQLKTALNNCYDHTGGATASILAEFEARLDEALAEEQSNLSDEAVLKYRSYAGTLRVLTPGVCPQT